jgi:hypothetical protein
VGRIGPVFSPVVFGRVVRMSSYASTSPKHPVEPRHRSHQGHSKSGSARRDPSSERDSSPAVRIPRTETKAHPGPDVRRDSRSTPAAIRPIVLGFSRSKGNPPPAAGPSTANSARFRHVSSAIVAAGFKPGVEHDQIAIAPGQHGHGGRLRGLLPACRPEAHTPSTGG